MNNIFDMLFDYSKQNKIIDFYFINKTFLTLIKENALEDYVKNIKYENLSIHGSGTMACYCYDLKRISFDFNAIGGDLASIKKEDYYNSFSVLERVIFLNTFILMYMLHEIEHAKQHKKGLMDDLEFETLLFKIVFYVRYEIASKYNHYHQNGFCLVSNRGDYLSSQDLTLCNNLDNKFGVASPIERLAYIKSIKECRNLLSSVESEIPNVMEYFNFLLDYYLIRDYYPQSKLCPTERYLREFKTLGISGTEKLFNDDFFKALREAHNDRLEKRLTLGLNIHPYEYKKIKRKMELIKN